MCDDGSIVPGIRVAQLPGPAVEMRVEKRDAVSYTHLHPDNSHQRGLSRARRAHDRDEIAVGYV